MVYYHTRNWLQENGNNSINGISEKNGNKKSYFNALKDLLENEADNELLCFREDMNFWW